MCAKQVINIGTSANDGTGDYLRDGGDKINDNFTELYDADTAIVLSKKPYHGVEAIGTVAFDNTDKYLSVASITYWYKGTQYTTASAKTCDLDLTADRDNSSNTITANTLYYFYFKDATGKLYWSDTPWNFRENVFVCTVFWTGAVGACQKEWHNHTRDIDWHIWAHDTVGTRYESGLDKVTPTTLADNAIDISTGNVHDEDLDITTGQQTSIRGWRRTGASTWTFEDYSLPYLGANNDPKFVDINAGAGYELTSVGDTDFVCYWVYASLDISKPIYVISTTANTAHNTITLARAETAPILTGLNSEMKLIYRFIYRGDGEFQESNDYRTITSLSGGVSASTTASAVSFNPHGTISATTVQTALEEVDLEKLANLVEDLTPQLGGELDAGAHSIGFTLQTTTGDGTTTIDWRLGNDFYFTFGSSNDTFTFTAPTKPCHLTLVLKQHATGGKTATWPNTVKWPAGTAPTLSTGASAVDIVALFWDGTNYHAVCSLNFSIPA